MDLRLMDNVLNFLHFDNLQNRYDHVVLAGASLMCSIKHKELFKDDSYKMHAHWNATLQDHIRIAKDLHGIHDVYIIEHQACGAYSNFLDLNHKKVDLSTLKMEENLHQLFSDELAKRIVKDHEVNVHCFFIDLRGNVKLLNTFPHKD